MKENGELKMKIKLAILEKDSGYLNRIVAVFGTRYADKFQIYSFTDPQMALSSVNSEKVDVLIANESFDLDLTQLPKRCSFAYFVDSMDIDSVNGQHAICKYQKAELIYKQVLGIFSENAGRYTDLRLTDEDCVIYTFSSPCGGTGTSCAAVGCAMRFASLGKRVLYLNFNAFDSTDLFFAGEGQFCMSDVIFSVKSKKANIAMKLESYVKQDASGVFFFSQPNFALDMLELQHEEKLQLLKELKIIGAYDCIILDHDFGIDKQHMDFYKKSGYVIMVSDGSERANIKIQRAYTALAMADQNSDVPMAGNFVMMYNRFGSKNGQMLPDSDIRSLGGIPVIANATSCQIASQIMNSNIFDSLD